MPRGTNNRSTNRRTTRPALVPAQLATSALVHVSSALEHDSARVGFSGRPALLSFVEAWLNEFRSPNTQEAYRRDLEQFLGWLEETRGSWNVGLLGRADLAEFARWLDDYRERGQKRTGKAYSEATKARKLAALSSFYEYALDEGRLLVSPVARIKRPKAPKESNRNSLSREQALELVELVKDAPANRRAVVALCLALGLRVSEALSLTAESLGYKDGHRVVNVLGKGKKTRAVPLSPLAYRLLEPALEAARRDNGLIVRTDDGSPVSRKLAARWLHTFGRRMGLEFTLVPHSLRHTAATLAKKGGADIEEIRLLLGHSDLSTTLRYVKAGELDGSAAYVLGTYLG